MLKQTAKAPHGSFPPDQFEHFPPFVAVQRQALSPHRTRQGDSRVPPAPSRFAAAMGAIASLEPEEEGRESVCLWKLPPNALGHVALC